MNFHDIFKNDCHLDVNAENEVNKMAITEPATGAVLGSFVYSSPHDIDTQVEKAKQAQTKWKNVDFQTRSNVLRRFAELLDANAELINTWNIRECGSIPDKAQWELKACIEQAYMSATMPLEATGEILPSSMPGRENHWIRVPLGVIGVISPWNFPLLLSLRAVLPALAMGNSVVLKPDVNSAVTGGFLIVDLLKQAGLPDHVCSLVLGDGEAGHQVVTHKDVHMIAFTGSTAVGRSIGEFCGKHLKKSSLELGGNNAFVVTDDVDIDPVASCAAWGSFLHQGQICMQSGRHIVHQSRVTAYASRLKERAQALHVGNPFTDSVHLGPMITLKQANRVMQLINDSVALGAKVLCGGKQEGHYIYPTVITDVTPDMPIYKEEIFGPVAPIISYSNDKELIDLIDESEYGLAAAIHCKNTDRARSIANSIDVGMVHINDQTVNNEYQVPFGGMKASGNHSRFGGVVNIDEFSQRKWISTTAAPIEYPF